MSALSAAGVPSEMRLITPLGMTLLLVRAGQFLMGSSASENGACQDERPQHLVRISKPFYLGAHPVRLAGLE